ncbi:MAG: DUF4349 domain-containing protein [Chloroflexi bacterium]|nr:MAG: DUF4349 domain-containing protein [Chloroflexota bacterium]
MKPKLVQWSVLILVLSMIILAGCQSSQEAQTLIEERTVLETEAVAPAEAPVVKSVAGDVAFGTTSAEFASQVPLPETRLIIRTAELSIVVTDTEEAMREITRLVESNEGWVVNSNVYQVREGVMSGDMTVRVPATGFGNALDAIKLLAVEVEQENISGQDVTEEYVDLSARLENLEATADRVRSFLDDAQKVEEALAVNAELSRLEGEIEVIKGRMQYLSQSAAYSTISVHLTPDVLAQPLEIGGWRPEGVARDAVEALVDTLQGLATVLIWLVIYVLPLAILIGLPLWFGIRWGVRRRQQGRVSGS